jgi:hypothetical protein
LENSASLSRKYKEEQEQVQGSLEDNGELRNTEKTAKTRTDGIDQ